MSPSWIPIAPTLETLNISSKTPVNESLWSTFPLLPIGITFGRFSGSKNLTRNSLWFKPSLPWFSIKILTRLESIRGEKATPLLTREFIKSTSLFELLTFLCWSNVIRFASCAFLVTSFSIKGVECVAITIILSGCVKDSSNK